MDTEKLENELTELMDDFKIPDNQITLIIKSAIEKDIHLQLFDSLKAFVTECENSLHQMCASNYSNLLDSINRLGVLKEDFDKFRTNISMITGQTHEETTQLRNKIENVVNLNNARNNIEKSKKMLTTCLPALNVFIKLNHELDNDVRKALEYYKVLEQELIPPVKDFRFIRNILESLPIIKERIRKNARDNVLEFLEKAKTVGQRVGKCVLDHAMYNCGFSGTNENYFKDIEGILDILDFSSLQRYMLIINEIGVKGKDEQFYKNERLLQVNILSDWSNSSGSDVFKNFCDHLLRLIGFFVIEVFVSNNVSNSFSKGQLNEIFDKCSQSLIHQLETQCELATISEVSDLKKLLSTTHYVMSICGLYSSILKDSEKIIKKKYNDIVSKLASAKLSEFKYVENLGPLVINNEEEEKALFNLLPLPKSYRGSIYPKTLPFSIYVPTVYIEVMKYVENTLEFNDSRTKANIEIEYDMKISAKHFFSCIICKNLLSMLDHCRTITSYVQVYYDVFFLDSYLPVLDSRIIHTCKSLTNNEPLYSKLNLKNDNVFKTILSEVDHSLMNFMECQLDQFVQDIVVSTYHEHKKKSNRLASTEKLINFLDAAFEIITKIPSESSVNHLINSIKYISQSIFHNLTNSGVILSPYIIKTLHESSDLLNEYVSNSPLLGVDYSTKNPLFNELVQIFSLLSKNDWAYFFDNYNRTDSIYHNVNPEKLIQLYTKSYIPNNKLDLMGAFQNMFRSNSNSNSSNNNNTNSLNPDVILAKLHQLTK